MNIGPDANARLFQASDKSPLIPEAGAGAAVQIVAKNTDKDCPKNHSRIWRLIWLTLEHRGGSYCLFNAVFNLCEPAPDMKPGAARTRREKGNDIGRKRDSNDSGSNDLRPAWQLGAWLAFDLPVNRA
jgi:hypothetical protein